MPFNPATKQFEAAFTFTDTFAAGDQITREALDQRCLDLGSGITEAVSALEDEYIPAIVEAEVDVAMASSIIVWSGAWLDGSAYIARQIVSKDGSSYICTSAHNAGAANAPDTGPFWTDYWDLFSASGADGSGSGDLLSHNNLSDVASKPIALANLRGMQITATSGGITILGANSPENQVFTGVMSQSITLPVTTTLVAGFQFRITNNSTQSLTIQTSSGAAIALLETSLSAMLTCVQASGTTAASWDFQYNGFDAVSGTGAVLRGTNPVMITPYSFSPSVYVDGAVSAGTDAQGQGPFDGDITIITTAGAAPSGVTLPVARLGRTITVINRGANPVNIYPAVGAAIVGKATNAPHPLAVAGRAVFLASSVTEWHVFSPATEAEAVALVNNTSFLTPYLMRLALNATGDAPTFATRAWATFNGTGTLAVLSSGGVASVTDLGGTGRYRITLSAAAAHANYAVSANCSLTSTTASDSSGMTVEVFNRTTTSFDVAITDPTSNNSADAAYVSIMVVY